MAKQEKQDKPVHTIDFASAFASHPAASLLEGATVDVEKRTAETADIAVEVGTVKTQEAPFDQEFLSFTAKTPAGVNMLAAHEYFRADVKGGKETPEACLSGLFNYALGLRLRGRISQQMKAQAAGPEKAVAKATAQLEAVAANLPPEAQAALKALLASLGK